MRITEEQEKFLDELICERLRDNSNSSALIQNFESKKGKLIVNYLKRYGLQEDLEGRTAFYIIRNKHDDVLMFFSLKCGELFEPLFDEKVVKDSYNEKLLVVQALQTVESDDATREKAFEKIKEVSERNGVPLHIALVLLLRKMENKQEMLSLLSKEKESEENDKVARVSKTYPGIELVHFCTNDNAKEIWKTYGLRQSMGEVLFWRKIVPKFFEVQNIVGCEYAFLFAADLSEDRSLINYYDVSLKFGRDAALGTNKPFYDFACAFMYQKLSDMKENREAYFNSFNIDEDEDIV